MTTSPSDAKKKRSGSGKVATLFLALCFLAAGLYYLSSEQLVPGVPTPQAIVDMVSGKMKSANIPSRIDEVESTSPKETEKAEETTEKAVSTQQNTEAPDEPVRISVGETKKEHVKAIKQEDIAQDSSNETDLDGDDSGMDEIFTNPVFNEQINDVQDSSSGSATTSVGEKRKEQQEETSVYPEGWTLVEDRTPAGPGSGQEERVQEHSFREKSEKNIEPEEGEKVVVASLPPQSQKKQLELALLNMTSRPDGARLYVDGEYKGKTPYSEKLSAEKHEIILQLEGYGDWKGQLDLGRGDMKTPLSVRLFPK
jgi:hypothetical protein